MHTKNWIAASLTLLAMTITPAYAAEDHMDDHMDEHGGQIFHAFTLEAAAGAGNHDIVSWDLDGWIGGDVNKLHLKSEGEVADGETEQAEFWALYSRNIDTFWDAQIGLRHDTQPESTSYVVAGFEGLAPYFFETEAHVFVSDQGDVSARLRQENEFLITQRLIIQPYLEANFYAQDVAEQEIGAGLSSGELGLQTRFETTRKFSPYVDLRYERKLGETSSIAKKGGGDNDDLIASLGLSLMF